MKFSSLAGGFAIVMASQSVAAGGASAQVLEINSRGAVKVFDGPMVFTATGATPIVGKPPLLPVHGRAHPSRTDIDQAADAAALSPALVEAVAWRESGFRTGAVSRAGAIGEMQLMPETARRLGVDPRRSDQNLKGGASYLTAMMRRYDGDLVRALAAYNAGPGAVDRYKGVPPFKETQAYVAAIMDRLSRAVALGASGTSR